MKIGITSVRDLPNKRQTVLAQHAHNPINTTWLERLDHTWSLDEAMAAINQQKEERLVRDSRMPAAQGTPHLEPPQPTPATVPLPRVAARTFDPLPPPPPPATTSANYPNVDPPATAIQRDANHVPSTTTLDALDQLAPPRRLPRDVAGPGNRVSMDMRTQQPSRNLPGHPHTTHDARPATNLQMTTSRRPCGDATRAVTGLASHASPHTTSMHQEPHCGARSASGS